eukprot:gene3787-4045_t
MTDGGSRFEEAICDLCGKAASPEDEECVTVVCATKCSAPKDCAVYHDKCMSKYMRRFCKGMDLARRHGYPCPKGKGKGNSMSKPCKGKVVHHNKVIFRVKSAPAPLPDVDVQVPAVAAGERVVGRLKAKRSLPEKAAVGRPQPAPRATAAPKPAPAAAALDRPFIERPPPKQDLLGRNLQAAQVQAKKAAKKNLQHNSYADDEYAEGDDESDWGCEEEVAAAMQRMPSAPGALAGNGANDLPLLDEGVAPAAAAGWQQGGLDAAGAWADCGAGTAGLDAAAEADVQTVTALQGGWATAAMYQTDEDCWTLPAASSGQLAGLGGSMAPSIQYTADKGTQYTAGAGGETPRQPGTMAAGGRQLQGSMTTKRGSGAMGFGSGEHRFISHKYLATAAAVTDGLPSPDCVLAGLKRKMAAPQLLWEVVKGHSSFVKKNLNGTIFSAEPFNLYNKHSYKYSGENDTRGHNDNVSKKRTKAANTPAKAVSSVSFKKKSGRRALKSVAKEVAGYRPDLKIKLFDHPLPPLEVSAVCSSAAWAATSIILQVRVALFFFHPIFAVVFDVAVTGRRIPPVAAASCVLTVLGALEEDFVELQQESPALSSAAEWLQAAAEKMFVLVSDGLPDRHDALLLLGILVANFLGQVLLSAGFQHLDAGRGSAVNTSQVLFGCVWDVTLLHAAPSMAMAAGALAIAAGVFGSAVMSGNDGDESSLDSGRDLAGGGQ